MLWKCKSKGTGSERTLRKEAPVTVATRAIARALDKGRLGVEVGCWIGPRPAPESAAPLSSGSWMETVVFSGSVVVAIGKPRQYTTEEDVYNTLQGPTSLIEAVRNSRRQETILFVPINVTPDKW